MEGTPIDVQVYSGPLIGVLLSHGRQKLGKKGGLGQGVLWSLDRARLSIVIRRMQQTQTRCTFLVT